ncbi:hypothetical protein DL98DRAFT_643162 [Cadophora sp. DSE1049]|nr:hypothetical protein DL98DRAFT_643162 [Cadophora sp. DSE1049]
MSEARKWRSGGSILSLGQFQVKYRNPECGQLDTEGNELSRTWARFRDILPVEDRVQFAQRPAQLDDVFKLVQEADKIWRTRKDAGKFGKAKATFRKICMNLGAHHEMLTVLPSSSQYVSIFYGTLQTLIKASVNYEKIAEGLSRAVCDINDIVAPCVSWKSLYPGKVMEAFIERLYANIFIFLRDAMLWYQRKSRARSLLSFKEDFYDDFETKISEIRAIAASMSQRASVSLGAEVRYSRLQSEKLATDLKFELEGFQREIAESRRREIQLTRERAEEAKERQLLKLEGSARFQDLLKLVGVSCRRGRKSKELMVRLKTSTSFDICSLMKLSKHHTKENIQLFSNHLENHFDRRQILPPFEPLGNLSVELQIVSSLQEWTAAADSRLLCVAGPGQSSNTPVTTSIAANYTSFAKSCKIPVISFFCELAAKKPPQKTREEAGIISLAYAIIRQLIELLPVDFVSEIDFGPERYKILDGTLNSWTETMKVLNDLLDLKPLYLFCVIDGFQWLDDSSTEKLLDSLLDVLHEHTSGRDTENSKPSTQRLKILFTTAGKSRCLLNKLSNGELVIVDQRRVAQRPGSGTPGRVPLRRALE